jgi:hypothetical protein
MNRSYSLRKSLLPATLVALALAASPGRADVIWDTGAPHPVISSGATVYLGYISGNPGPTQPQRWAAIPFQVSTNSVIRQVDLDWFINPGNEGTTVQYIIWQRTGLTAPTTMFSSGTLGAFGPGVNDPRLPFVTDWLHHYSTNIPIPAGDYYLTVYAAGGTPNPYLAWLTGGDLQPPALQQDFMWRSEMVPVPGFQVYNPATIQPTPGQNPNDRWVPSFALFGDTAAVPEPGSWALLGLGAACLLAVARRQRNRRV